MPFLFKDSQCALFEDTESIDYDSYEAAGLSEVRCVNRSPNTGVWLQESKNLPTVNNPHKKAFTFKNCFDAIGS